MSVATIENVKEYVRRTVEERKCLERLARVLSKRQIEIGSLVADGFTNEEIAEIICCSPETVKTHVRNIFRKIEADRRHDFLYFFRPTRDWSAYPKPEIMNELSKKDRDFLDMVAEGYTDAKIADLMGWRKSEVTTMLNGVRKITGLFHRNEIALWWLSVGLGEGFKAVAPMTFEEAFERFSLKRTNIFKYWQPALRSA
jgi:DNA-binding CsgD family transcriptional regulator